MVFAKSIGSGKTSRLYIKPFIFEKEPFQEGSIVFARNLQKDGKGYWWLHDYDVMPG